MPTLARAASPAARGASTAVAIALVVLAACGGGDSDDGLEDGRHFGRVVALDPLDRRLELDPATLVEDDDGTRVENPVVDPVGLPVADDATIRLLVPCCDLHVTDFASWAVGFVPDERTFYGTSDSHYEVTVTDGRVIAVDEVRIR